MGRHLPVLLALLFALSSPVGAVAAPQTGSAGAPDPSTAATDAKPSVGQSGVGNNSTRLLTLDRNGTVRSAYVTPSLSLSTALDARHAGIESEFGVALLEERLAHAETAERKREIIFQFTYEIEDRIEDLRARDERARGAFVNGSISASTYAQRLAAIDAKAERIRTVLDRVRSISRSSSEMSLETRYWSLRFQLGAVTGPVRDQVIAIATGREPPARIYVSSTDSGVVLAMIDDGMYVREITRLDSYDPDGEKRMSFEESQRRVSELYPQISNIQGSGGSSARGTNIGISRFTFTNAGKYGEVTIYFDARTGEVFKEIRRQRVSLMETTGISNTEGDLTATANYTFPTGPVQVTLTDAETGKPVNGTVLLDGEPLAGTGSDGRLRFVAPAEPFTVTAVRGNETVNVTVRPGGPPRTLPA